ncbi:MAG: hypothetical protein B1H11_11255 [Desulfobacteraceae bacterium 4484_190.1]|nr:MAG: hypothetical protein B1H11_11255 [Desulfobacteraceae bacterium 4484_190.1]
MERVDIKILGISGTPIKGGNCDKFVHVALEAAKELGDDEKGKVDTEFLSLAERKIAMCKHCQWCIENMQLCNVNDDANEVLEKIGDCDGLIFGSPTWLNTLSPPLLNLFSRARYYAFFTNRFRNKIVGALTVGFFGFGLERALDVIKNVIWSFNMISVAEASALTSTRILGQRPSHLEHGVSDDLRGMKEARLVGLRVVEVARMIKCASERGVVMPEDMQRTVTRGRVKPINERMFVKGVWRERYLKEEAAATDRKKSAEMR